MLSVIFIILGQSTGDQRYPAHPNVVDVTQAPYRAKGDGVTDATQAIQQALNDHVGTHRVLFFPKGTYLVSDTLRWPNEYRGRRNWGFTMLRGESREGTILRLKDGAAPDPTKPKSIMWCGGFGSADWFHTYVENMTFHVGARNPGAIGLQFYSNNTGAVRDLKIVAPTGSGLVGLDLAHRDMNGPLLARNITVEGFQKGVSTARAVNSQTFENLRLTGQTSIGFDNEGQPVSIRGMIATGAGVGLRAYGTTLLVDATFTGVATPPNAPAIVNYNGGRLFVRNARTSGFGRAIADLETPDWVAAYRVTGEDKPGTLGPVVREYASKPVATLFPSPAESLNLPVKETPEPAWDPPARWAVVDRFGADPKGESDSGPAIQRAIDSGATTVFLPGHYRVGQTIVIRGAVRRIVGLGGWVRPPEGQPVFRAADGSAPTVWIEHFGGLQQGGILLDTKRTLVLRSVLTQTLKGTPRSQGSEVFLEDVGGDDFVFDRQKVWARQLNIENEGTHLTNRASDVWILGYKTERGGTLAKTVLGGRTEILGGFSYTTTAGKLAPMFVNEDSSLWTFFAEICFNGDPYTTLVRERRGGVTREISASGHTLPFSGRAR